MAPTFEAGESRFQRDLRRLTPKQRAAFLAAVRDFVADLRRGAGFRPGLRVKRVQKTSNVWELTWAPDGRATWQYGPEVREGEPHVRWRRVGTHDIFRDP
jgi:hypothetical protein